MTAALDILGAGAFGTGLAIAYARAGRRVTLWARSGADEMTRAGENARRLPGHGFPAGLRVTGDLRDLTAEVLLLAVPTQALDQALTGLALNARYVVSTAKGLHLASGQFPTALIAQHCPEATPAQFTGPSFADDIARGLPTALTLACADEDAGEHLQRCLHLPRLRPYRSTDLLGAEIGGALKNVYAIACGAAMGAGMGVSTRAALMTRGFAEMTRFADAMGADSDTLKGLSGLGDLALTCGSDMSRNYRFGHALGQGAGFPDGITVEGVATAQALVLVAEKLGVEMPVAGEVARMTGGDYSVGAAMDTLMGRALKPE